LLFLTFMFFVAQVIIPTDFTTQFAMGMNHEAREQLAQELGIDQPLWAQYLLWFRRLFSGSLGTSFYGYPVLDALKALIPYTLLVFLTGTLIAFTFGQWLGKVTAWRGPGLFTSSATLGAITLYTTFPPWLAFLITYFLARRLDLFRAPFSNNPFDAMRGKVWRDFALTPQTVMLYMVLSFVAVWLGLLVADRLLKRTPMRRLPPLARIPLFCAAMAGSWRLFGFGPQALDILSVASLPLITYVLLSFGETMLIMRTSMMDTIKEDYVSAARAKGLPDRVVRDKHAARNALLPVFSRLAISLPYLLTGLVIIEDVLNWPGISGALFNSMYNQDIPMVMGALLIVGVLAAVARLGLDVLYAILDPRIRYGAEQPQRPGFE
jgi:peptide/nickel transport system permease protein